MRSKSICYALLMLLVKSFSAEASGFTHINTHIAHEGPVCVLSANRLYFTTKPDFSMQTNDIAYLDLKTQQIKTWLKNVPMANGMILNREGDALIVALQGNYREPSAIAHYNLKTKQKHLIIDNYQGIPFNSLNKVIQTEKGWLYFSDPNYGEYQGFKLPSRINNGLYLYQPKEKKLILVSEQFDMPHGLAFNEEKHILYLSDTAALNGRDPYDKNKTRDVYQLSLNQKGTIRSMKPFIKIKKGIPDGLHYYDRKLYIASGEGVLVYALNGELSNKIKIPQGAVTLTICHGRLYVLSDTGIYIYTIGIE